MQVVYSLSGRRHWWPRIGAVTVELERGWVPDILGEGINRVCFWIRCRDEGNGGPQDDLWVLV